MTHGLATGNRGGSEHTPAQLAQRKAEIVRLYDAGKTFTEIGAQLDITRQWAHRMYWQAVAETPALAVTEMRAQQNERYEQLIDRTQEIMNRTHVVTSGGKIVCDKEGVPLRDSGPELQAINTIGVLLEKQARLNGTNAPAQVTVNGQINYVIEGIDLEALK